jgi:hypothetical protein
MRGKLSLLRGMVLTKVKFEFRIGELERIRCEARGRAEDSAPPDPLPMLYRRQKDAEIRYVSAKWHTWNTCMWNRR